MKTLKDLIDNYLVPETCGQIVHFMASATLFKPLESPRLSTELECEVCQCKTHYAPYITLDKSDGRRVWICASIDCLTTELKNLVKASMTPAISKRALEWRLFCEIMGLGDAYYPITFEGIDQSPGKITYMLKFVQSPSGIIFMQGTPGNGKTYASLGMCEMFTRTSTSCMFITSKKIQERWLETYTKPSNFIEKVNEVSLLVIDDFGTYEVTAPFMAFFMELINNRMQWLNKGTVITTNLKMDKFNQFCGEALADRIATGQQFKFEGKTRRKSTIL